MTNELNDTLALTEIEGGHGWTVKNILEDHKIMKILDKNPHIRRQVERAAEILVIDDHPIAAIMETIRGLVSGRIEVFFSYKMGKERDEETAAKVVSQLRRYAPRQLKITYAGDFLEYPGTNWDKKIRESIGKAQWFILLLPDPTADWDWCLFETGLFRGKMVSDKVNKLFCLHHPEIPTPPQIKEFQATPANPECVKGLLKMIYLDKDPIPGMDPINPEIGKDLDEIAKEICMAISPPAPILTRTHFERYVMLKVEDPKNLECPEGLNNAAIIETDPLTLKLFGKRKAPKLWSELIDNVVDHYTTNKWLTELCAAIRKAANNSIFRPIQATFEDNDGGRLYQPILYALDEDSSGSITSFKVLFVEDISAKIDTRYIPKPVQALLTSLKLAYRFRWEILERFDDIEITGTQLKKFVGILERIESEGRSRGLTDPSDLYPNFNEKEITQLKQLFERWFYLRNDNSEGKLDKAIAQNDGLAIKKLFPEMSKINKTFLEMAADRLQDLS